MSVSFGESYGNVIDLRDFHSRRRKTNKNVFGGKVTKVENVSD
jgi:hypothetical protein